MRGGRHWQEVWRGKVGLRAVCRRIEPGFNSALYWLWSLIFVVALSVAIPVSARAMDKSLIAGVADVVMASSSAAFIETLPKTLVLPARKGGAVRSLYSRALRRNEPEVNASSETLALVQLLDTYYRENEIQKDQAWLAISGWKQSALFRVIGRPWRSQNQDPRGFASSQGMRSPRHDFIELGKQFFITDTTYVEDSIKCRLPEKYAYFKRLFPAYKAYLDHPNIRCEPVTDGFLNDLEFIDPVTGSALEIGPIDATTVTGFELLYATPGVGDPAEIAGHIVLRILLANNPQAETLGIENPKDIVVSFLANTQEASLIEGAADHNPPQRLECKKSWLGLDFEQEDNFDAFNSLYQALKGLSGGFLTTMDRQTLAQTVHHYTVYQDRNLVRYRLNLSESQKEQLLARLYAAKKNYNGRYFFFKENCGSILYRVVGEGIGNEAIASFDPIVTPPNALLTYLVKQGVASRVYPSFLSYRQKGYVAQELLKRRYADLRQQYPAIEWPKDDQFYAGKDSTRKQFFERLAVIAEQNPSINQVLYSIASIAQEAEQSFGFNEMVCRNITSQTTASLRQLQKNIIHRDKESRYALSTRRLVEAHQAEHEFNNNQTGFDHTGLLNYSFSFGRLKDVSQSDVSAIASGEDHRNTFRITAALHAQQAGDRAKMAMQRATSIVFGEVDLLFAMESGELEQWRMTGLHIQKFKERLNTVPAITSSDFRLGIGLTALNFNANESQHALQGQLVGAELLANLVASPLYSRHLFLSLGVSLDSRWQNRQSTTPSLGDAHLRIGVPLALNGLWSFDPQRRWQLGFKLMGQNGFGGGHHDRRYSNSMTLSGRLGELWGREIVLIVSSEATKIRNQGFEDYAYRIHQLGVSVNPW